MATDYDKELDSIREDLDDLHDNKVDVVKGKQLSTNDFTNEHLRKVNRIETKEYQQEIVSGVTKDLQQANDNHVRLADEFHRHLYGQDGVDAKFRKEIQDNLNYMGSLVKSANDHMNEIWQNWDEIVKEDQNHELRLQQVEGKTLTHDALIDSNTSEILNIQGEQVIQNNQIKEMQDKNVELETRVVDVEVSDADQNHRLDIAENRIGTFTDRMTALEDGYAQRDARMDGLDAQVSRYTERMLALELNEKAQNDRIKAEEEKNKRQDIDIACLYAEAKDRTITLDTEGTAIELQNSREGFVVTNSIEGNTMVNCNKDVDKEVTLLTSTVDVSSDNNVTLTEGVVDGGKVDVYLEGNTLVNVSKTKDVTPITHESEDVTGNHIALADEGSIRPVLNGNTLVNVCDQKDPVAITKSYTVETGNHVALQGEYDGKCRPVITGNTLVNLRNLGNIEFRCKDTFTDYTTITNLDGSLTVTVNSTPGVWNYIKAPYIKSNMIKPSTVYTIIFNRLENITDVRLCNGDNSIIYAQQVTPIKNMAVVTTSDTLVQSNSIFVYCYTNWSSSMSATVGDYVLLEGDYTNKPIPEYFEGLQSSFEDKVVTQEMVDNGEELAENLGKYKVDYVISKEDDTVGQTKTFYLNSPLLEGDTIEQQGNNVVHVHRSEIRAYETDDELTLPTDMTNTLITKATPTYELISQNNTILCDSYVNGHLDVDSVVPIEKVVFRRYEVFLKYIYPSTSYTIQFESDNIGKVDLIKLGRNELNNVPVIKGLNKFNINVSSETTDITYFTIRGIGFNASNIVITPAIEQDFGYFRGMQSCFEDNLVTEGEHAGKYEVTYKVTGKNKFNKNDINILRNAWIGGDAIYSYSSISKDSYESIMWIKCKPNTTYTITKLASYRGRVGTSYEYPEYGVETAVLTGSNKDISSITVNTGRRAKYLLFSGICGEDAHGNGYDPNITEQEYLDAIQIEEGSVATPYEPYKEYKKTFYLNSPLLEGDTIEEKDGNIYHVHRYKELLINTMATIDSNWSGSNTTKMSVLSSSELQQFKFKTSGNGKCDNIPYIMNNSDDIPHSRLDGSIPYATLLLWLPKSIGTSPNELRTYLNSHPLTFVLELKEPQYELIQQSDTIVMPTYSAGHLDVTTAVPVDKVNFLHFEEELTYLYPATSYTVQFNSDNAITVDITLGGKKLMAQSVSIGLNKITITTPETLTDNKLIIDGVGANIKEVVVTNSNREFGYFEGMKSVGECEDLEVISSNKNLLSYPYENSDKTAYGITFTDNGDGSITINGTSTEFANYYFRPTNGWSLPPGDYVFSLGNDSVVAIVGGMASDIGYNAGAGLVRFSVKDSYVNFGNLVVQISPGKILENVTVYPQLEKSSTATDYIPHASNTQTLTHEPLRAVGDIKDKYILIDSKWYIERNCGEVVLDGSDDELFGGIGSKHDNIYYISIHIDDIMYTYGKITAVCSELLSYPCQMYDYTKEMIYVWNYSDTDRRIFIHFKSSVQPTVLDFKNKLKENPLRITYQLETPTYEPIDYSPFEVYNEVTHISANSTIPCNVTVKNHGYNCILKPSTTYTVVSNQGVQNMTTPATLGDSLRFSGNGVLKDVMILEGTLSDNQIPGFFAGMESSFEQHKITDEYDEHFGYYEVSITVRNEDGTKESNIKFYIKDPLRGIGEVKDKVFVEDGKVKILRNCGQREYTEGDFEIYVTDKSTTVYPLETPTYEEAVYSGIRLSQNIWEKSTLFFDTNIPSTANISYSISTPVLDQVAEVSSITDDQDALIIDMATQLAVLNMTM